MKKASILAAVATVASALAGWPARAEEAATAQAAAPQASAEDYLKQARDAFKRRRSQGQSAKAVDLYEKAISTAESYEALWEGARAASELGQNAWAKQPSSKRSKLYKKGMEWAERATKVQPDGAEGHYYTAVLTGLWAEQRTFLHQMASAADIRRAAERAYKINPRVECGGPAHLLGLYYRHLPAAFGGDDKRAVKFLEQAVRYCPGELEIRYELAECLSRVHEKARALEEAQWVLDHPPTAPHEKADYEELKRQVDELIADL
jgi:tetratricopeptide (TPR) repeat protein